MIAGMQMTTTQHNKVCVESCCNKTLQYLIKGSAFENLIGVLVHLVDRVQLHTAVGTLRTIKVIVL